MTRPRDHVCRYCGRRFDNLGTTGGRFGVRLDGTLRSHYYECPVRRQLRFEERQRDLGFPRA